MAAACVLMRAAICLPPGPQASPDHHRAATAPHATAGLGHMGLTCHLPGGCQKNKGMHATYLPVCESVGMALPEVPLYSFVSTQAGKQTATCVTCNVRVLLR